MIGRLRAFWAFAYDFVIGDDWRVAAGVVLALLATYLLAASTSLPAWWLVPAAVVIMLPVSLWRAVNQN